MEGFWTVQFLGVNGLGAGVVTLLGGQLFGGDSGFLYSGNYETKGNILTALAHVEAFVSGVPSIMGREKFDVELTGKLEGETIQAAGFVPGTKLRISGCLTKKSDLPVRA